MGDAVRHDVAMQGLEAEFGTARGQGFNDAGHIVADEEEACDLAVCLHGPPQCILGILSVDWHSTHDKPSIEEFKQHYLCIGYLGMCKAGLPDDLVISKDLAYMVLVIIHVRKGVGQPAFFASAGLRLHVDSI